MLIAKDNMMHKLTSVTYLITSWLKRHSKKNDQRFSFCIPTENSFSPPSFNVFQRNFEIFL